MRACIPTRVDSAGSRASPPSHPDWRRPQLSSAAPTRNSWFYVPLLLHAAGQLEEGIATIWRSHTAHGARWQALAASLAAATPISTGELVAFIH